MVRLRDSAREAEFVLSGARHGLRVPRTEPRTPTEVTVQPVREEVRQAAWNNDAKLQGECNTVFVHALCVSSSLPQTQLKDCFL